MNAAGAAAGTRIVPVAAFVDWHSQLMSVPKEVSDVPADRARWALRSVTKALTRVLCDESPHSRFRVLLRVYSGWSKGYSRTENYVALSGLADLFDLDALFPSTRISVISTVGYGDRLLEALAGRELPTMGVHLPNTLRQQDGRSAPREKMVDTALASDLLSWVRS
jgi:hypothetical protein